MLLETAHATSINRTVLRYDAVDMWSKHDAQLLNILFSHYDAHARDLPWRQAEQDGTYDPYKILVSEIMLQQTQVQRVIPKYDAFVTTYPTITSLAEAELSDVISLWLGLGYNRRAKYLYLACRQLQNHPFPRHVTELTQLDGIGPNTAAAILTYAYDQSHIFIETNIRTVLLHHYHENDTAQVDDHVLAQHLRRLLATNIRSNRDFYWAMMDYGTYLKSSGVRAHRKSRQYKKQSTFAGSKRQLRGKVLQVAQARVRVSELLHELQDDRGSEVLQELVDEALVSVIDGVVVLNDIRS
jgi:A/G-specific adenine glycosylase